MSTALMTPPPLPDPPSERNSEGQLPRARPVTRQTACFLTLLIADVATMFASLELAIILRTYLVPHLDSHLRHWTYPIRHYLDYGWLWMVLVVFLSVEGLYTRRRSLWNEVGHINKAVCLGLVAMLAAFDLTGLSPIMSRATILLMGVNLLILLPIVRFWTKRILCAVGLWRKRILILGSTEMAKLAIRGLTTDPFLGYQVVGLLDDDPKKRGEGVADSSGRFAYVLGNLSEARAQMELKDARDILIAMPSLPEEELVALVHQLQPYSDSIFVVPQLWGLPMMNLQVDGFLRERVMMLRVSNNLAKPWNAWLKRSFDLLVGTTLLLLTAPLGLILSVLILLDSVGPVFFVQERLGYRGKTFRCLKFRTMRVDGEKILARHLKHDPHAAEEWRRFAKLRKHDPRLTRLGGFLRRWSLDEFPQLLNVLKGEMSLVGPRPYLPRERKRIGEDLPTIVSARPGMTGFWQVSGRNHLTLDERVQLEAWYVRNWTVWFDCIILARTFGAVLFPQNRKKLSLKAVPDGTSQTSATTLATLPAIELIQNEARQQADFE
jgi:undecaprenyl-phosphate galactose phosphotransferase